MATFERDALFAKSIVFIKRALETNFSFGLRWPSNSLASLLWRQFTLP